MNAGSDPQQPLRVILAAENASVRFGGEAILPYHYLRLLLARGVDVHLVVHDRCRAELLELFPTAAERLHFIADQPLQRLFYQLGKKLPRRLDEATLSLANQMLTQHAQRTVIRRLIQEAGGRAVIHQPIPVSPRTPSLLAGLGAPLVCGPLNGGMNYPAAFRKQESLPSRMAIALARSFTDLANTLFPGKRDAALVLVANQRTREALPANLRGRVVEVVENGVDVALWNASAPAATTAANTSRSFVFIGRLVDWKALDIAIDAINLVPGARLDVVGAGPMLEPWQAHAAALGLTDRVTFHGWKSQAECATMLANAHALVLPSLFECGGAVVLEAMAMSRPVIATAWGGPADYLNADCGILIEPTCRAAMVAGFADAMHTLSRSPEPGTRMGSAGRARLLAEFDWNRKIEIIMSLYTSTLS